MADFDVMQTESVKNSMALKNENFDKHDGSRRSQTVEVSKEVDSSNNSSDSFSTIDTNSSISKQEEIDEILENMNVQFERLDNYLRFEKDESTEKMVVFIKDIETDEVIRQIPSQELLAVSKNISKYLEAQKELNQSSAYPPGLITHEQV